MSWIDSYELDELRAEVARLRAEASGLSRSLTDALECEKDYLREISELRAEVEKSRVDAERWRFFRGAGFNVTLRMHYTRPDEREKSIDAAMGEGK